MMTDNKMRFPGTEITIYGEAEVAVSRIMVPGLSERVYSLTCEQLGIFKHDLRRMVHERRNMIITESDLSDVISCLKQRRGIFIKRGYGYFGNEDTFNLHSFWIMPGKDVRKSGDSPLMSVMNKILKIIESAF